jgi:hypothetical protein
MAMKPVRASASSPLKGKRVADGEQRAEGVWDMRALVKRGRTVCKIPEKGGYNAAHPGH